MDYVFGRGLGLRVEGRGMMHQEIGLRVEG
jgi:hypothetical protein